MADRSDGAGGGGGMPLLPLLCLHGWGRTRRDLAGIASGRSALLPDLPGFGSSPPPAEAWGAGGYARLVAEVAEADGGGPFIVVGHSFGGKVATCLGAERPDLVAGIVEVGAPLVRLTPPAHPPLRFRFARLCNRLGLLSERRMEAARLRRGSPDYVAAVGVMRQVLVRSVAESYEPQLAALACPVAFCWGEKDSAATVEVAERAAALVPHLASFEVVPGAGHDVHLSHPDAVGRAIGAVERALTCR